MGSLFKPKPKVRCSHILVKDEKLAKELLYDLQKGADFASKARQHSECPSKANGGDLGEFSQGMMVKEFDQVAFTLAVGALSNLVKTKFGWHIIKRTA